MSIRRGSTRRVGVREVWLRGKERLDDQLLHLRPQPIHVQPMRLGEGIKHIAQPALGPTLTGAEACMQLVDGVVAQMPLAPVAITLSGGHAGGSGERAILAE